MSCTTGACATTLTLAPRSVDRIIISCSRHFRPPFQPSCLEWSPPGSSWNTWEPVFGAGRDCNTISTLRIEWDSAESAILFGVSWVRDCPPKHMPTPALIRKNKDWNSAGLEEKQEEPGQKWLQRRAQKRKMSRKELNVMKLSLVFVRLQTEHMSRCQCASCKNNSLFIHTRVGRQLCSYITWGRVLVMCVFQSYTTMTCVSLTV